MKAAFFRLPGKVEVRDVPVPEPGPGEVLVRVARSGICGSDVACFGGTRTAWHRRGHEFSGYVERAGADCSLERGMLVSCVGSIPCGACRQCRAGKPRLCSRPAWSGADGFAEFVCKPERFFFPCRDLTPDEASLMEPLTVAIDLVADGGVAKGSTVLLVGAGPIGLKALRLCLAAGARRVYVSHPSTSRARVRAARRLGATAVLAPDRRDLAKAVLEREPEGVDCVLVTAKLSHVLADVTGCAAMGAKVAFIGMEWKPAAALRFDVDKFHFRKLRLVGSNHNPCGPLYPKAAELLRTKKVDAATIISHHFPLARIAPAFARAQQRAGVIKVVVDCAKGERK